MEHSAVHRKAAAGQANSVYEPADTGLSTGRPGVGLARRDLTFSLAQAVVRRATTLPRTYGPMLAVAGARAGSGLWFTATAAQLTLFHLSVDGALRSWPLPASASSVRAGAGTGLAVTVTGVAWIGVGPTLLRLDTTSSQLSTWQVPTKSVSDRQGHGLRPGHRPTTPGYSMADSVAVSQDGVVAVAMSDSSSVQVLDPREGTFRGIRLPAAADRPLALGYTRNGTLGIGYARPGRPGSGAVLLVTLAGAERSARVSQPTAVAAYGPSGLLVGVSKLDIVRASGRSQPLLLPADSPGFAGVTTPPVPLPGDRLGIATDTAILTFPAAASLAAIATGQSELWVTPSPRCQPDHSCPAGYRLLAADADGDVWLVPKADPRTVDVVSLR